MPETKSNYGRGDGDKGGCEEKGTVGDRGDGDDEKSVWSKMPSQKARKPNRAGKKLKRTHFKKPLPQHKNTNTASILDHASSSSMVSSCSSTTTSSSHQDTNNYVPSPSPAVLTSLSPSEGGGGGGCYTPKAHKYRIPELLTCPPAPKKQRVPQNCVLRRRQIVFFAPPDIELFFVKAVDQ
ncbi:unnamed protein product [Brassica oleracea var. botrytis]|uniref:Uncharacterized protein n=2 Tax=Brassica oleracea TaxID=3712 RepID=A0A3P6FHH2_BRAOL|nr:unnamed protein product [Brassica oleracea]